MAKINTEPMQDIWLMRASVSHGRMNRASSVMPP